MSEALFVYDDGIGEETERQNILNANETGIGMSMEEFRENSMEYFKNEIGTYVPMCLSVFISILITIMVLAALNYRKGLDVMGIYFACGMSPKKALVLNAVSTACTCVVSVLMSILIMELFHLELGNKIFLRMGALQIWVDAGLILIIAVANIFVPVWNMYKLSPAESIRKRGMMA
jgi:ABC-type antimicrobial peptide transport system permease subunit